MTISSLRSTFTLFALSLALCACRTGETQPQGFEAADPTQEEDSMLIQYLEVVTPDVDATCGALEQMHGVSFAEPDAGFGGARIALMKDGGRMGVRAPMAEHESPTVRPYMLVSDINAALSAAEAAGAQIAMGATPMPGQGTFAIYILGGIQHGLWQN